jgi:SLA1 homology domain 1, SHD1
MSVVRLTFVLLFTAFFTLPMAEARTWTNREGKEIEAEFVDANETMVSLRKSDDSLVRFKIELLCDDDQELIRNILLRRRVKNGGEENSSQTELGDIKEVLKNAPAKSSKPTSAKIAEKKAADAKSAAQKNTKISDRAWTDVDGNKIIAKFVSLQGQTVSLLSKGKTVQVPLDKFSALDRQYMAKILSSIGETFDANPGDVGQLAQNNAPPGMFNQPGMPPIATLTPSTPSLKNFEGLVLSDGRVVTADLIASFPPEHTTTLMARSQGPETLRKMAVEDVIRTIARETEQRLLAEAESKRRAEAAEQKRTAFEAERLHFEQEQARRNAERLALEEQRLAAAEAARVAAQQAASTPVSMPSPAMQTSSSYGSSSYGNSMPSPSYSPPVMQEMKMCMNCRKAVPNHLSAGDSCPHCKVHFDFDETNGKKSTSMWSWFSSDSSSSSSSSGDSQRIRISGRSIKGLIALGFLAVGGLFTLFRKLTGQEE